MSKLHMLRELGLFLRSQKRYWIAPLVVALLLFGALLVVTEGSVFAPFIYSLF